MNQSNAQLRQKACAVFFVSTGRCGTQWFGEALSKHYSEIADVRHEPFHEPYNTRHYYRAHKSGSAVELSQALKEHIETIETILTEKNYIETGWPAYALLPTIIKRFDGRIKIVHLYRHPVAVASSLVTHNVYGRGEWTKALAILPSDSGVRRPELETRWASMSRFQKCLFWWTEINSWALDLHAEFPQTPWFSLKFEDVFGENGNESLRGLLEFLNFPIDEEFLRERIAKVDRFQLRTSEPCPSRIPTEFPEIVPLSTRLGYELQSFDKEQVRSRYYYPPHIALARRIYRRVRQQVAYAIRVFRGSRKN